MGDLMATETRLMFVNHTGQVAGAELILLDVVQSWPKASAFLFEDGPLGAALAGRGLNVMISKWGRGLSAIRRDSSVFKIIPLVGRLCAITVELAQTARNYDVLYANSQKAFVLSAIATLFVRRPLIWHLHDIISAAHFGSLQRRAQVTLANLRATKVIVPSSAAADAFVAEGGRSDLVEVVANGLSVPSEAASRTSLRQDIGLPTGPLVGVFSRLAPWKGQHIVLQALPSVPGVNCIIAGDSLFGEQAYAARLRQMVADLGLADRVHFLGQRDDVPKLMRAVDAMIHPSIDPEPFGRTLIEAMLAGVPVIATDAGAASDILAEGKAGTLVAPDNPEALANAIRRVLFGAESMVEQLEYAGKRARSLYSLERMLLEISRVVSQVSHRAYT